MEEEMLGKIESYLKHQMSLEEEEAFEKEMNSNSELLQKVNEYKKVFQTIDVIKERTHLKNKLNQFHSEVPKEAKLISLNHYFRKKRFAIAASIALCLSVGTLSYLLIENSNSPKLENARRPIEIPKPDLPDSKDEMMESPAEYAATAFMISTKGYLLTAKHLVVDANEIVVENSEGKLFKAEVVFMDPLKDIAFLKISDTNFIKPKALPYAFMVGAVDLGDKVFTLGFPQENIVYEEGVLSGRLGFQGDSASCQVSLSINLGNSGGPLFDDKGNVVGMIFSRQKDKDRVAFALTMNSITDAAKSAPEGTFESQLKFNSSNKISRLKRNKQIKKVESFVYQVKVD